MLRNEVIRPIEIHNRKLRFHYIYVAVQRFGIRAPVSHQDSEVQAQRLAIQLTKLKKNLPTSSLAMIGKLNRRKKIVITTGVTVENDAIFTAYLRNYNSVGKSVPTRFRDYDLDVVVSQYQSNVQDRKRDIRQAKTYFYEGLTKIQANFPRLRIQRLDEK